MVIVKNRRDKRKGGRIVDSLSCCGRETRCLMCRFLRMRAS